MKGCFYFFTETKGWKYYPSLLQVKLATGDKKDIMYIIEKQYEMLSVSKSFLDSYPARKLRST